MTISLTPGQARALLMLATLMLAWGVAAVTLAYHLPGGSLCVGFGMGIGVDNWKPRWPCLLYPVIGLAGWALYTQTGGPFG